MVVVECREEEEEFVGDGKGCSVVTVLQCLLITNKIDIGVFVKS